MYGELKAVIFDMDGVLIESESLWRKAMIQGFKEVNMDLSEADCRKTMGLRIGEVIEIWLKHFNYSHLPATAIEARIIALLLELIEKQGEFIPGIPQLLSFCNEKKIKTGIATSSSNLLMNAVIKKLQLESQFDATLSAEHMTYGKPHPEVFLACASKMNIPPQYCLVIEDSFNGAVAAKAAQMKVIAVPDDDHIHVKGFAVADYRAKNMEEVLVIFKTLFS